MSTCWTKPTSILSFRGTSRLVDRPSGTELISAPPPPPCVNTTKYDHSPIPSLAAQPSIGLLDSIFFFLLFFIDWLLTPPCRSNIRVVTGTAKLRSGAAHTRGHTVDASPTLRIMNTGMFNSALKSSCAYLLTFFL